MKNELFLQHHGILGQKWGIRRYQNKDGSLTEAGRKKLKSIGKNSGYEKIRDSDNLKIPIGNKMYRVSPKDKENSDTLYLSYRNNDRNFYNSFWSRKLKAEDGAKNTYEQEYSVKKDLILPSAKTRRKILSDLAYDEDVIKDLYGKNYSEEKKQAFTNMIDKMTERERAKFIAKYCGNHPFILTKYGKKVVEIGFNAVPDEGTGKEIGEMPIIVFAANNTLSHEQSKKIDEITEALGAKHYSEIDAEKYRMHSASI